MTQNEFVEAYQSHCYGYEHPTHVYVSLDLWESLEVWELRLAGELLFKEKIYQPVVVAQPDMPLESAHFVNELKPHHYKYNSFVSWAAKDTRRFRI